MKLGPSYFARFSPDGSWVASCSQRSVQVRHVGTSKPEFTVRLADGAHGEFSPDSRALLLKTTSGLLVALGPLNSTARMKEIRSGDGEGGAPRYSACGGFILDCSWSGSLMVLDSTTGEFVDRREFPEDLIVEIASTTGGDKWVAHHSPRATTASDPPDPNYFSVWSLPLRRSPHRLIQPRLRFVQCSALSGSGALLALKHGAPPDNLSIVDAGTGETLCTARIKGGGTGGRMVWAPSGELAVVERDRVRLYSASLEVLGEIELEYACDVSFSPCGELLAIGSWSSGRVIPKSEILS